MEWRPARDHFKQHRPYTPKVCFGIISLMLQNLRRHVQWRSAKCLGKRCGLQMPSEAKVGKLQSKLCGWEVVLLPLLLIGGRLGWIVQLIHRQWARQEQILRLNVAVDEFLTPQKLEACGQIAHEAASKPLGEPSGLARADQPLQITSGAIFEDQIKVPFRLLHVVEADDVRMAVLAQNRYLQLQILQHLLGELLRRAGDGLDGGALRRSRRIDHLDSTIDGGEAPRTQTTLEGVSCHHLDTSRRTARCRVMIHGAPLLLW
mmetsp:Transcript_5934/g.16685  ORF Transcript_5934/g.16685 Transcript_5934/m.16685 type:complete len:261 (-) Transcript_5934:277-1059(-)